MRLLGTAVGTNTDTKGDYEMTVPKADTLMVEFSCLGYSTVTRQLIKPEGTVTINPKLYEKTLELEGVEITEYKKQTTGMQGIDVEMLKRTPPRWFSRPSGRTADYPGHVPGMQQRQSR